MNCSLCESPLNVATHGSMQLPCGHAFHIRCGLATCERMYSAFEPPQCRICLSRAFKENTIIPPASQINVENVITIEQAYQLANTNYSIDKRQKLDEKLKELTEEDMQFWREYIELSKEELKLYKARNVKAWRVGREFKQDVSHLTALYNKSFRKYYKQFMESEEFAQYKALATKVRKISGRLNNYMEQFIDPYDLTIKQFLRQLNLIKEDEQIYHIDINTYESFVPAFNEFDKLYDKKNLFKK